MTSPRWRRAAAGLLVASALLAAAAVQAARDARYPRERALESAALYIRSPDVLRRLVLSFDALAADVYWIRAVQHYGGDRRDATRARKYELLYPLLDITTSLDPYFTIAYRFGAILLSEPYPSGPGRSDLAIALLRKGIAAQPEKWEYYHDAAFVQYWQLQDLPEAARWFRLAAAQPGAPRWLEPLAAAVLVQGGDRASARFLLQELAASGEPWLQRNAARSLLQLDALDLIDRLQPIVHANRPPEGQPFTWSWLIRRGVLRRVPSDPAGAPLSLDPATGAVSISRESDLFPLPGPRRPR